MALRIRCPKCGTMQRVPTGVKPTCPKCGFAGNAAAADTAMAPAPQEQADVQWEIAPATPPSGVDAMEAPAGEQWAQAEPWPQADEPADQPKKKGWFGRSK